MKRLAWSRFSITAVSVISKQILLAGTRLLAKRSMTKFRNWSSPSEWPDRLIAHTLSCST